MELEFYGAASGVTGSCHILRTGDRRFLLDCGLIQGRREEEERNREPFPFDPREIDAVVLSHAHIDHSGRLPLLVKEGFKGPIFTQSATRDLCEVLLLDSASLAERDTEYENRKRARHGEEPLAPLYSREDAQRAIGRMRTLGYGEQREILPGVRLCFHDAGHILGSSQVELLLNEGDKQRKLVFSGDIGQYDTPILNDPARIGEADLVLMEATYGDRLHRDRGETIREIGEIIRAARHDKGNILIPAFAVGRSQEILYYLGLHYDEWDLDRWQVFLDSPMAIETSRIYWEYPQLYDAEATKLRRQLHEMPQLRNLHLTATPEESMAINRLRNGAIIIAGSGMCNGGRIVHHLKHNIENRGNHVIIVGYQANGTLGRRLVNREPEVRIHRETYSVMAQIHTVGGLSAHADQQGLLRWLGGFDNRPQVYLVHGEDEAKQAFKQKIGETLGLKTKIAGMGERLDLTSFPITLPV